VARGIEEVLTYSRPYGVAEAMERVISDARREVVAAERATVAAEVTRLVERSGLSRAEFATMVGTSPSRLSTYITGKVTPSAALMVRMSRVADALRGK
jgi:DNA-binding transcriptional regulator YiaG